MTGDADDAVRSRSFGGVAGDYDRLRPAPPGAAVAWLLAGVEGAEGAEGLQGRADPVRVLDLAAGTGLMTRALLAAGADVVAVEPDERMRAVLSARTPGVRVLAGVGEDLPLPEASVDAVVVASAWHWMDPVRAVPEVARVLRDGGRFAAVWTGPDSSLAWVRQLRAGTRGPRDDARAPDARAPDAEAAEAEAADADEAARRRHHSVDLPAGSPFTAPLTTHVRTTTSVAREDVVALMATYSAAITATVDERAALACRARAVLDRTFPGAGAVDLPLSARCWRADRLARPR